MRKALGHNRVFVQKWKAPFDVPPDAEGHTAPDGFSLHMKETDAELFFAGTLDVRTRDGVPYQAEVDDEIFSMVTVSKKGIYISYEEVSTPPPQVTE